MFRKTTLVIGTAGKAGRRVAERLEARNLPVRLGSRSGQPPFDWAEPATWPSAVRDAAAVYITYYPDLAAPGASDAIRSFTGLAIKSGVQRLVLLSGRGEPEAQLCEEIVREAGVEYTLLRASWFAQNFSESFLLEPILAGEAALPVGNVGEPFIHTDDIADAAIAALTEDRRVGQLYELTGSRLWTFAQAIAEIARVTNRSIRYVQISTEEYTAAMKAMQLPPEFISFITYLLTEVLDGRNASTTDGLVRALGRPPRDFSDYVRETAATGVWHAAPQS